MCNNLPPILDIIRGCSDQVYRLNRVVIKNNRPQTKGFRRYPHDILIAGPEVGLIGVDWGISPSYAGVSEIHILQQQNLEMSQRIDELEKRLTSQSDMLDKILKHITP
jgi:Mg2+ and Co2+ transporter CorA